MENQEENSRETLGTHQYPLRCPVLEPPPAHLQRDHDSWDSSCTYASHTPYSGVRADRMVSTASVPETRVNSERRGMHSTYDMSPRDDPSVAQKSAKVSIAISTKDTQRSALVKKGGFSGRQGVVSLSKGSKEEEAKLQHRLESQQDFETTHDLCRQIAVFLSLLAPIRRLPPEVLSKIIIQPTLHFTASKDADTNIGPPKFMGRGSSPVAAVSFH
ncbi:hypothetical protein FB45DRAFT_1005211 [Roridomyces roridus]|uniref:Uncharacterized protein n=1 Tax=Roridomyces roridus TaxID=1738132 RepID=A0AAD7FLM2_9AGAR|nr:hypothetical protein FB45DRAFT_1005211 [Roridomyces roridus]